MREADAAAEVKMMRLAQCVAAHDQQGKKIPASGGGCRTLPQPSTEPASTPFAQPYFVEKQSGYNLCGISSVLRC